MARPRKNEGIRYLAFLKTLPSGSKIYYIKFFDDTGAVFSIRSSGTNNRDKAHAFAGKLLATENFRALALKKRLAKCLMSTAFPWNYHKDFPIVITRNSLVSS